jgi:hypothetical protein
MENRRGKITVQQEISDFTKGFSDSITNGLSTQKQEIGKYVEKSKTKLFVTVISIVISSVGVFITAFGIASYVDKRFAMQGLGFVLVGIMAILTGSLLYRR